MVKYRCPYCNKVIEEVSVVELVWKRLLASAGLGLGCGLMFYALAPRSLLVGAVGAFIIGFTVVFLMMRGKK